MPVINIKMGKITDEKKKELIEKITETGVEVTQIPESSFTVFVEEYDYANIGVAGQVLAEKFANQ